jgi:hypothetical protein
MKKARTGFTRWHAHTAHCRQRHHASDKATKGPWTNPASLPYAAPAGRFLAQFFLHYPPGIFSCIYSAPSRPWQST